ncbi:MAG: hypothetical protein ACYDDE_00760 [bacterium]
MFFILEFKEKIQTNFERRSDAWCSNTSQNSKGFYNITSSNKELVIANKEELKKYFSTVGIPEEFFYKFSVEIIKKDFYDFFDYFTDEKGKNKRQSYVDKIVYTIRFISFINDLKKLIKENEEERNKRTAFILTQRKRVNKLLKNIKIENQTELFDFLNNLDEETKDEAGWQNASDLFNAFKEWEKSSNKNENISFLSDIIRFKKGYF